MFDDLQAFQRTHGHTHGPSKPYTSLLCWVVRQNKLYADSVKGNETALNARRFALLTELGFIFLSIEKGTVDLCTYWGLDRYIRTHMRQSLHAIPPPNVGGLPTKEIRALRKWTTNQVDTSTHGQQAHVCHGFKWTSPHIRSTTPIQRINNGQCPKSHGKIIWHSLSSTNVFMETLLL
jgi:hypothetical protein